MLVFFSYPAAQGPIPNTMNKLRKNIYSLRKSKYFPRLFLKSFLRFLPFYVKIWHFYVKMCFIVLAPGLVVTAQYS